SPLCLAGADELACCESLADCAAAGDVTLYATERLFLADRVAVYQADGASYGTVVNLSATGLHLGVDTTIGNVLSRGSVTLRDRAVIDGYAVSESQISIGNGASVSGSSIEGGVVLAPGLHGFLGTFPGTGGVDVRIERDEIVELEPGSYGLLDVRGGGQLIL